MYVPEKLKNQNTSPSPPTTLSSSQSSLESTDKSNARRLELISLRGDSKEKMIENLI